MECPLNGSSQERHQNAIINTSCWTFCSCHDYSIQQLVYALEVCTGSKLKPEPGPYPRLSDPTRPDPSGTVKFRARTRPEIPPPPPQRIANQKKKEKGCISRLHARNRLIKALPFHKHLPVMKVCEHQVQRSHTFCRVYEFCMDKKIILPPYKLWSFFVS